MAAKTKELIKETFLAMLNEKPYGKITVSSLVEACGVNRNTFYYYFQDIPSLVEEITRDWLDQIIAVGPAIDSLEKCVDTLLSVAREHRGPVVHIYRSTAREVFEEYLWRVSEYAVASYYENVFGARHVSEEDKRIILRFYSCMCFGEVIAWLNHGMKEDLTVSFRRICELGRGHTEELIVRAEESQRSRA